MSKIICDVCGTSYAETATQCPICGCARPGEALTVNGDTNEAAASSTYNYVKGGRFSKSNVRKRNRANQSKSEKASSNISKPENKNSKDKWLTVTALALLLLIVAVIVYIVIRFFNPFGGFADKPADSTPPPAVSTDDTSNADDTQDTTDNVPLEISCTGVKLAEKSFELDSVGASRVLSVTVEPVNTTDALSFMSSNEAVAVVTSEGKVTAVGGGEAVITVTCGEMKAECTVVCTVETEPPTSEDTTAPEEVFELNREDFTLSYKGDSWDVYDGDIDASKITWTTDDEKVATIENGKVTAVGPGVTKVHGVYDGVKVSCIVRCGFTEGSTTTGGVTEDNPSGNSCTISHEDVTVKVGESFNLSLTDASGNAVSVEWTVNNSSVCSVSGSTITGATAGTAVVSTTYEGSEYSCIVRVSG